MTRVMIRHDRVSRIRKACMQKRIRGLNVSGVPRMNRLRAPLLGDVTSACGGVREPWFRNEGPVSLSIL